jgi:NAD(P)-dependent dehydrogenase (short-subunit alcohol dehydrogenase family)
MPTILITGANRGLGLEFTKQYAVDKWDVIAACRSPSAAEKLQNFAKTYNNIRVESLDVGDHTSISALAAKLENVDLDVLLNNAGILSGGDAVASAISPNADQVFGSIDAEAWDKVLRINVIAPIMINEAFLPHLQRGAQKKIIMISSRMGSIAMMKPGHIAYRTSKAALNAAMKCIVSDLAALKIAIVNFHPGWVQTDMGSASADITPNESIAGMRKVIAGLTVHNSGQFLDYGGNVVPW